MIVALPGLFSYLFYVNSMPRRILEVIRQNGKCAPKRLKSTCTCAQSDLSLRCPNEETLHPCLSKMHPKITSDQTELLPSNVVETKTDVSKV